MHVCLSSCFESGFFFGVLATLALSTAVAGARRALSWVAYRRASVAFLLTILD